MKIPNKRELQQIALNHSSDIDFKDFMNIYKKHTKEPTNQVFLKTFNSGFQEVKEWFTDQTSKPLELENKINITLIIK